MEARGRRDEMVIATKFTGLQSAAEQRRQEGKFDYHGTLKGNYSGNSAKNIHTSIERSLKNLRTAYLDIVSTKVSRSMSWADHLHSTTSTYGTTQLPYRS